MYASMLMFINELERQGQDTSNGWKTPKRNERREISDDQNRRKGTGRGKRSGERRGTGGEAPGWRGGDALGKSRRELGPRGKPALPAALRDKQESFHWAWGPKLPRLGFRT